MTLRKQSFGRKEESGNVLFLILIAVALFAALSYAVTQSTRSSGGDAGKETNRINSAQLTQYPASVRTSIVRMVISGQDINTLEFNDPALFTAGCTVDGAGERSRCVFHPEGGGATYVQAPGSLMNSGSQGDWIYNGDNEIENIGTTTAGAGVATGTVDLMAFLPGVSQGVCESINEELGMPTATGSITEDGILYLSTSSMINPDAATPTSLAAGGASVGATSAALVGQPFGCFFDSDGNADNGGAAQYVYYHVLVER